MIKYFLSSILICLLSIESHANLKCSDFFIESAPKAIIQRLKHALENDSALHDKYIETIKNDTWDVITLRNQ